MELIVTAAPPARTTRRRFQLRLALLVALGVFAQESVWNFHDSQTPVTLAGYTTSVALIGLIMGLDNIIGIFVQPLMGYLSDKTRTRLGRRTPFIIIGVPVAALLFVLIPLAPSFPILIAIIVLFSLTANSFKPITEALIADQQPPEHRSKANAFGRFASGLTIIVSALLSLFVVDESVELAYVISAVVMVACFAILLLSLRESRTAAYKAVVVEDEKHGPQATGFFAVFKDIFTDRDRSRLFMILAVIVTWGAWAAVRALLTLYGVEHLGLSRGEAGGLTLPASVAFLLVIIPLAILSDRFGRRRVMRIGIIVFATGSLVAFIFNTSTTITLVGILVAAAGFAGFAANATVMLWNLAPSRRLIGVYTGIFAVSQAIGSSVGPAAVGALVDATDWGFLMLFLVGLSFVGLLLTLGVRREYSDAQLAEEELADAERSE